MVGVLILSVVCQGQEFPSPPYVRDWTYHFDETLGYSEVPQTSGQVAYMTRGGVLYAFDLNERRDLWSWKPGDEEYVGGYFVEGNTVYATTSYGRPPEGGKLAALNAKDGELIWALQKTGDNGPVSVIDGIAYTMMTATELWAIELETKKTLWKANLQKAEGDERRRTVELEKPPIVSAGRVFVATGETKSFGLDAKNGKILWQEDNSYSFGNTPLVEGKTVIVPSKEGLKARDVSTGQVIWSYPEYSSDFVGTFAGNFVLLSSGRVISIDTRTGQPVWQSPIDDGGYSGGNNIGFIANDTLIVNVYNETVAFSREGNRLWSLPDGKRIGSPIWFGNGQIVCAGHMRLIGYKLGDYPALPTGVTQRTELATKLANEFEMLDEAEITRLKQLGDVAVIPLADKLVEQGLLYEKYSNDESLDSYRYYSSISTITRILAEMFKGKETMALIERAGMLNDDNMAKRSLMSLVAEYGDAESATPKFLAELKALDITKIVLRDATASKLKTVSGSSLPEAVDFMISLLKNKTVDPSVRELAYVSLAEVGGEKGLAAVLEERIGRQLLKPLGERMGLNKMKVVEGSGAGIVDIQNDANGTKWALIRSGVLGSYGDLWIAKYDGDRLINPMFTGLISAKPPRGQPLEEQSYKGHNVSDLISGLWLSVLVGDAALAMDRDGDGLTDIAEKRLGTNPTSVDTDGDGNSDLVDPWPTVKPRTLSDEEKFYSAAFEARFHFSGGNTPAVFSPEEEITPFEMPGWRGPVIWISPDPQSVRTDELNGLWEHGVAFIGFSESRDFTDESEPTGLTISWNESRTEGTVIVSTYYGGLNGTGYLVRAKKFGNEWVVVEMSMAYIS